MVFILNRYDMEHSDPGIKNESGTAMAAGVSPLSDLPPSTGGVSCEGDAVMETASTRVPTAKYTKVGETLRHVIPGHMQCSMACGGRACKYENPSRWSEEEQAVKGLYSSWITDNLLAMARPSTEIIEKYNIIDQFKRYGLRTIINLQRPGEHASCGNPLEPESGFTYRPEAFMEAGIYFYNFGWKDYGVASLTTILDMVKVMSFAIQEGKMAVHCHAGLGRTGVLLACYLVFTTRMSADQAILFVRAKRPNSIQTRGQLLCVREFAQFLVPLRNVFSCAEPRANAVTLSQYLTRQRHLLHGYEARQLKNVPKIVPLTCRVLLDIAENRQVVEEEVLEIPDLTAEVEKTVSQQAIQQLGKEMIGKGIAMPSLPCTPTPALLPNPHWVVSGDHDLDLPWQGRPPGGAVPQLYLQKSRSYSDSELHRLGSLQDWSWSPLAPLTSRPLCDSLSNFPEARTSPFPALLAAGCSHKQDSPYSSAGSVWKPKKAVDQEDGSPLIHRRRPLQSGRRSMSLGSPEKSCKSNDLSAERNQSRGWCSPFTVGGQEEDGEHSGTEIPFTSLQTELTPVARRLLVARALAMDLDRDRDGGEHRHKVLHWQTELNSREGAWERVCSERDPFVLSGLMWSWLEQLKEPIITQDDVQALGVHDPHLALNSLDKGTKQTLMCILDCAAHVLAIPGDLEGAFLERTIKAFTKVGTDSDDGQAVYTALKAILTPVLHEMRTEAAVEAETACHCMQVR